MLSTITYYSQLQYKHFVYFIFADKPIPEDVNPLSSTQVIEPQSHSIHENTRTEP